MKQTSHPPHILVTKERRIIKPLIIDGTVILSFFFQFVISGEKYMYNWKFQVLLLSVKINLNSFFTRFGFWDNKATD